MAANVPLGMSFEGALKSPLMLIPAMIPVTVGKNTPNTLNQLYPSSYFGYAFSATFLVDHPVNPEPVKKKKNKMIGFCHRQIDEFQK